MRRQIAVAVLSVLLFAAGCGQDGLSPAAAPVVAGRGLSQTGRVVTPTLDAVNLYRCNVLALVGSAEAPVYRASELSLRSIASTGPKQTDERQPVAPASLTAFRTIAFARDSHRRLLEAGCVIPNTEKAADMAAELFPALGAGVERSGG